MSCKLCGESIELMVQKGTGVCSQLCQDELDRQSLALDEAALLEMENE